MPLSSIELTKEKENLAMTSKEIEKRLEVLGKELDLKDEELHELRRYLWEEKGSMDEVELSTGLMQSEFEADFALNKLDYYRKLYQVQKSPYFGRIDFKEEKEDPRKIYIGLTNLEKDLKYLIYDWRSPIASMFYDYGIGDAKYVAPEGEIKGKILLRRQYKIEDNKLIRIFDNNLNVVDECLQEVLADQSSEKMKNIVNTIQQEQNQIIRNVEDKNLIVQGIAGSGKTSVALHRIAFLLYKIKDLNSSNILIFSPNNVFSEYISNVLPELGEKNVMETTFHDFAKTYINEYKKVQSFTDFIETYYTGNVKNKDLIKFKLSRKMVDVIDAYVKETETKINFLGVVETKYETIDNAYLNYLLKERYNNLPIYERLIKIAEHIAYKTGQTSLKYRKTLMKELKDLINIKPNYKNLYKELFQSNAFKKAYGKTEIFINNDDTINYEDALCFIYLKGMLAGFPYSSSIKQIVIDEAQDYNELQYIILSKIFKQAAFTILGDVNQTINPYQKYETLNVLKSILNDDCRYLELNKTYRSSFEIIAYTNKILGLNHVSAIRNKNNIPVKFKEEKDDITKEIERLRKTYKSVAVITKDKEETLYLYNKLKNKIDGISMMQDGNKYFNRDLVIIPSYLSKGLEFDAVISYTKEDNRYTKDEKYLFYVVATRCQHELVIYNQSEF